MIIRNAGNGSYFVRQLSAWSQKHALGKLFPRVSKLKEIWKSQVWSNTEFPVMVKCCYSLTLWSRNSSREKPIVNLETTPKEKRAELNSAPKPERAGKLAKQAAEVGIPRVLCVYLYYRLFALFRLCGRLKCILIWDIGCALIFFFKKQLCWTLLSFTELELHKVYIFRIYCWICLV